MNEESYHSPLDSREEAVNGNEVFLVNMTLQTELN